LESLASRRTDIFGIEECAIGKKTQDSKKDKNKQNAAVATWDGHAGSAELVTARAKKTSDTREFNEARHVVHLEKEGVNLETMGGGIGPLTGQGEVQLNPNPSSAGQRKKGIPPPPPTMNPFKNEDGIVPHVIHAPSLLTQKLPPGNPNKRQPVIENKTLEEKMNERGDDYEQKTVMTAGDDLDQEAAYAGLNVKRAKLDILDSNTILSEQEFLVKFGGEKNVGTYTIQCPTDAQWALTGQRIEIIIDMKASLNDLKNLIQERTGMVSGKQKLQYDGKFMNTNGQSLAEYNCKPGGVIHLVVKSRGGKKNQ